MTSKVEGNKIPVWLEVAIGVAMLLLCGYWGNSKFQTMKGAREGELVRNYVEYSIGTKPWAAPLGVVVKPNPDGGFAVRGALADADYCLSFVKAYAPVGDHKAEIIATSMKINGMYVKAKSTQVYLANMRDACNSGQQLAYDIDVPSEVDVSSKLSASLHQPN